MTSETVRATRRPSGLRHTQGEGPQVVEQGLDLGRVDAEERADRRGVDRGGGGQGGLEHLQVGQVEGVDGTLDAGPGAGPGGQ